jgi:hypothetical protein
MYFSVVSNLHNVVLSSILLIGFQLSIILEGVIMLSIILLIVILLSGILLNVFHLVAF